MNLLQRSAWIVRLGVLSVLFVATGGCQKETTQETFGPCFLGYKDFALGSEVPTQACADLIDACQSATDEFTLIYTSNQGNLMDILGGGTFPNANFVNINNEAYYPFNEQSYLFNYPKTEVFGNEVCIHSSGALNAICLRAPQPILAKPLNTVNNPVLDASQPQFIRWVRDTLNPVGQIFIQLTFYPDASLSKPSTHIKMYLVNDRDEAFDILSQCPPGSKAIRVSLTRVNGMSISVGSRKVFLNYRSDDIHFYEISE
jgi:hypothetical protein